ncbi:MAG: guanylate kinase [Thermodesulfobacteriota bacterium]
MKKGQLFIVSGPSGSGKTTLSKKVIQEVGDITFVVSYTTREPRLGEREGVDYKFITDKEFDDLIANRRLSEWAIVHGHRYGTPVEPIDEAASSGIDFLLDIDVQGARNIRAKYSDGVYIFVLPSSLDILRQRLMERKSEGVIEIDTRLEDARKEIQEIDNYDYIIINDFLAEASENLAAIILSERCRKERVLRDSKLGFYEKRSD